jgi:1-acyl-sn-glycerol-3-phosphate acyltransferase
MLRLLSFLYWTVVVVTCPFLFAGALLIWAVTAPFDRRKVVLHLYSCAWAVCYVRMNPLWRLRTSGRRLLPWRGAAVLVANHASLLDILALFDLFRPFKWVSKAEIFRVPVIGWNMRLNGYVPLVRGSGESVRRMMARCGELLDQGVPVLLFPEGRRTDDGRLQTFRNGAFDLAVRHRVPVFPIAVHGTGRALPKHGMVLRAQVDVRVEVLAPLQPSDYADVGALRDAAHRSIAAALERASHGNHAP